MYREVRWWGGEGACGGEGGSGGDTEPSGGFVWELGEKGTGLRDLKGGFGDEIPLGSNKYEF